MAFNSPSSSPSAPPGMRVVQPSPTRPPPTLTELQAKLQAAISRRIQLEQMLQISVTKEVTAVKRAEAAEAEVRELRREIRLRTGNYASELAKTSHGRRASFIDDPKVARSASAQTDPPTPPPPPSAPPPALPLAPPPAPPREVREAGVGPDTLPHLRVRHVSLMANTMGPELRAVAAAAAAEAAAAAKAEAAGLLKEAHSRLKEALAVHETLNGEISDLEAALTESEARVERREDRIAELEETLRGAEHRIDELSSAATADSNTAEAAKEALRQATEARKAAEVTAEARKADADAAVAEVSRLAGVIDALRQSAGAVQQRAAAAEADLAHTKRELGAAGAAMRLERQRMDARVEGLETELRVILAELDKERADKESLRETMLAAIKGK